MKKYFLAIMLAVASVVSASAADFGTSLGVNFLYGSKKSQKGIGVNYKINFTDNFRVSPEFQYYFSNDNFKTWDANANLEYTFPIMESCNVYPIVGFSYSHWTEKMKVPGLDRAANIYDRIGGNLGAGIEYYVSERVVIAAEVRAQLFKHYSQCMLSVGARYIF